MSSVKMFFADALGWRSQAANLTNSIGSQYPEIEVARVGYRLPKWLRPILKDVYGLSFPRRLNFISAVAVTSSTYGQRLIGKARFDAAILLGGSTVGLVRHFPVETKVVVVTDMTHALANRLFGARYTQKDFALERSCLSKCTKIFAMSSACLDSLAQDYELPRDSLELFLPPTELPAMSAPKASRRPVIGFVGSDFRRKGGHDLVRVFIEELAEHSDLQLVTSRYEGPAHPQISAYASLPHKFIVEEFLPKLDIFCLPTYQDCSGLAIAEALASGLPVVTTRIPGVQDLVVNERTGLLVAPGDRVELKNALMRLIIDTDFRIRSGEEARDFAVNSLDLHKAAQRLVGAIT